MVGVIDEYNDMTEVNLTISSSPYVAVTGTAAVPEQRCSPWTPSQAMLNCESVLVRTKCEVVTEPNAYNEWVVADQATLSDTVIIDDYLHNYSGDFQSEQRSPASRGRSYSWVPTRLPYAGRRAVDLAPQPPVLSRKIGGVPMVFWRLGVQTRRLRESIKKSARRNCI